MTKFINISDCPYTGAKRKLEFDFAWKRRNDFIQVDCLISYYNNKDDSKIPEKSIPSFTKTLIANNSCLVDIATGKLLIGADLSNPPANSMPQYSYLVALTLSDMGVKVLETKESDVLETEIIMYIIDEDSRGRFDNRDSNIILD